MNGGSGYTPVYTRAVIFEMGFLEFLFVCAHWSFLALGLGLEACFFCFLFHVPLSLPGRLMSIMTILMSDDVKYIF